MGRCDGPQSCSIDPPHNVPGLYLSVVPVSSILIRDPLVSLSNNLTKLASSPRKPGRSASARRRRISIGLLANVANTSRLRRSRAPANRRGGLVLLLDIVVAAGCLARRWRALSALVHHGTSAMSCRVAVFRPLSAPMTTLPVQKQVS